MADPEVMAMIGAALRSWAMPNVEVDLAEYPGGECADCRKPFDVLYGTGRGSVGPLCGKCQSSRLRVAAKLGAES